MYFLTNIVRIVIKAEEFPKQPITEKCLLMDFYNQS